MIRSDSEPARFLTRLTNGEHVAAADATADKGGGGLGFRPHELLEAALAGCMNMTLRMCAEKHAIPLESASVTVCLDRSDPRQPMFSYRVQLRGALTEGQRLQLLSSLEHCPVRTTLSQPLRFAPL